MVGSICLCAARQQRFYSLKLTRKRGHSERRPKLNVACLQLCAGRQDPVDDDGEPKL